MPSRLERHILAPLALLLGLAGPAAAEAPPVQDPEAAAQSYVDAIAQLDFDRLVKQICGDDTECEAGRDLRDSLVPLKGTKLTGLRKAIDLAFPDAIRQIYYSGRLGGDAPFHLRFTFMMTDAGWQYRGARYATGASGEPFPNSLLEGSLIGLTGASGRAGPATTVDALGQKIIDSIASRDFDAAANAVKLNIPNLDDNLTRTIDGLFASLKHYELKHIRKIIDKEIDNQVRQQFYYSVSNNKNTMYIRLT